MMTVLFPPAMVNAGIRSGALRRFYRYRTITVIGNPLQTDHRSGGTVARPIDIRQLAVGTAYTFGRLVFLDGIGFQGCQNIRISQCFFFASLIELKLSGAVKFKPAPVNI